MGELDLQVVALRDKDDPCQWGGLTKGFVSIIIENERYLYEENRNSVVPTAVSGPRTAANAVPAAGIGAKLELVFEHS